jgi:hypothetical protein
MSAMSFDDWFFRPHLSRVARPCLPTISELRTPLRPRSPTSITGEYSTRFQELGCSRPHLEPWQIQTLRSRVSTTDSERSYGATQVQYQPWDPSLFRHQSRRINQHSTVLSTYVFPARNMVSSAQDAAAFDYEFWISVGVRGPPIIDRSKLAYKAAQLFSVATG